MRSFADVCERVVGAALSMTPPPAVAKREGKVRLPIAEERATEPDAEAEGCHLHGQVCLDVCGEMLQAEVPAVVLDLETFDTLRSAEDNPLALCDFARTCTSSRRTARLVAAASLQPSVVIGDYLATLAQVEAGCVTAFEDLALELTTYGAPDDLVQRAQKAREDEQVHVVLLGRLAARHGATASVPSRRRRPRPRSLASFACRNAAEGCGSEAFNAVASAWAARTARDLAMRSLVRHVAADEARHADLAREIHAWVSAQLPDRTVVRLHEIRDTAIRAAARDIAAPQVQSTLGVPSPTVARDLAERLVFELRETDLAPAEAGVA